MGLEWIIKIINKHKKTKKDPEKVWINFYLDNLREKGCLCLNCDRKNDNPPYSSCRVAAKIYNICVENNMAMAITRCGVTDGQGNLMYRLIKR